MTISVLMYGWEFPPRISGGLGVACHAIVKELSKKNIKLTLVLPEAVDSELETKVAIVGCDKGDSSSETEFNHTVTINKAQVETLFSPYIAAADYERIFSNAALRSFFSMISIKSFFPRIPKNFSNSSVVLIF